MYYDVDPDDVCLHMGPFREAFERHFLIKSSKTSPLMENKVEKWREALTKATSLSGLVRRVSPSGNN